MTNKEFGKQLEKRSKKFAVEIILLSGKLPNSPEGKVVRNQITKSGTSIGANYREANDALGKKDLIMRMKIARKEAKETIHWLDLIEEANPELKSRMQDIKQEALEIKNILSSIIKKIESK